MSADYNNMGSSSSNSVIDCFSSKSNLSEMQKTEKDVSKSDTDSYLDNKQVEIEVESVEAPTEVNTFA